nr:MAG TPA: hypothetical protein [Caudoviricetes sp.]
MAKSHGTAARSMPACQFEMSIPCIVMLCLLPVCACLDCIRDRLRVPLLRGFPEKVERRRVLQLRVELHGIFQAAHNLVDAQIDDDSRADRSAEADIKAAHQHAIRNVCNRYDAQLPYLVPCASAHLRGLYVVALRSCRKAEHHVEHDEQQQRHERCLCLRGVPDWREEMVEVVWGKMVHACLLFCFCCRSSLCRSDCVLDAVHDSVSVHDLAHDAGDGIRHERRGELGVKPALCLCKRLVVLHGACHARGGVLRDDRDVLHVPS